MAPITKCVIPAAGFGTRFLPATKAQPKEMLPVVDTPVIQYLVEEAVASGITDIVIVTGRGKRSIEDHFDHSFELASTLVEKGKKKELEIVERVSNLANIAYVRQPVPRGDGDAILRARPFVGDEPFLVLFGDDLVRGDVPAARQLIDAHERTGASVIALEEVSESRVSSYGIVEGVDQGDDLYRVARFLEKPKPTETASRLGVIGKYVVTPDVFDALERSERGADGELRLANAFEILSREKSVYGLRMRGERYDTGDKLGFLRATVDFALAREDLGEEFRAFLRKRVGG